MPHIIIIYDDDGNPIGSYMPPHEGDRPDDGGLTIDHAAMAAAVANALEKHEDAAAVVVSFKAKKND